MNFHSTICLSSIIDFNYNVLRHWTISLVYNKGSQSTALDTYTLIFDQNYNMNQSRGEKASLKVSDDKIFIQNIHSSYYWLYKISIDLQGDW